jgi:hypothetical protein
LPVIVIDQFTFEVFLHPFEGVSITSFAYHAHCFQAGEIVLFYVLTVVVLLADGADGCWGGVEVIYWS